MTPANTPATPPNFPETLLSFNKLSTSPPATTSGSNVSNDHQLPATNQSLSSSPMMMMMMMDGTA